MTHPEPTNLALSGSIRIDPDSAEDEFRRRRDEVCDEYEQSEGSRLPGQLRRWEYGVALALLTAAFAGILLNR